MSRPKKDAAKLKAEEATLAYANAAVAAKPEPDPIVEPAVWVDVPVVSTVQVLAPVVRPIAPCALEGAPLKSKCVVSRTEAGKAVRLLSPGGVVTTLGTDDIFYTLPEGAKVFKVREDAYDVYRMVVSPDPLFTTTTAREAVTRFLKAVA